MIATVDIASIGARRTLGSLRRRRRRDDTPGLLWSDTAVAVPLANNRPPGLGTAVRVAFWDDDADLSKRSRLLDKSITDSFQAVLRPLRAFGSWPGVPGDLPHARTTPNNGPVLSLTLGRLRPTQTVRFMRASRPAERAALAAAGFVWGTAAARPPFVATISVWQGPDAAANYAWGNDSDGHPQAITAQRRKDFHRQSAFIRFAPISVTGTPALDVPPGWLHNR